MVRAHAKMRRHEDIAGIQGREHSGETGFLGPMYVAKYRRRPGDGKQLIEGSVQFIIHSGPLILLLFPSKQRIEDILAVIVHGEPKPPDFTLDAAKLDLLRLDRARAPA